MTARKPVATLSITTRPTGVLLYELQDAAGVMLWTSLGYASESGKERTRSKLNEWNQGRYRVELKGSEEAA